MSNNVMRHEYKVLTEVEKTQIELIKDNGLHFYSLCETIGNSRELSLAKTKVEEAVMWAVKHITNSSVLPVTYTLDGDEIKGDLNDD